MPAGDLGGGLGKGGAVTLYIDGTKTGEGRLERTEPIGFGGEFTDIGRDDLSPSSCTSSNQLNRQDDEQRSIGQRVASRSWSAICR